MVLSVITAVGNKMGPVCDTVLYLQPYLQAPPIALVTVSGLALLFLLTTFLHFFVSAVIQSEVGGLDDVGLHLCVTASSSLLSPDIKVLLFLFFEFA